jgi:retinol dehydrogenase-14
VDLADLEGARRYGALRAYYQSKLANVLFTRGLAARLAGTGVTATCVDPGLVATDLLREHWWWRPRWLQPLWRLFLQSPTQAAARVIHAASAPELAQVTGECLGARGRIVRTSRRSHDADLAQRLWTASESLVAAHARPLTPD